MNRDLLHKELIRDEGSRRNRAGMHLAYLDTMGNWTVGYGHLLGKGKVARVSQITDREARSWLNMDIDDHEALASELVDGYEDLDDVRQRALLNMAFNLGGKLADFVKFLAFVNARDWKNAGAQMEKSAWWGQVGDRAKRLRIMLEEGVAP